MAFGFIKKIFSFGKKEEAAPEAVQQSEALAIEVLAPGVPAIEAPVEAPVETLAIETVDARQVKPEIVEPEIVEPEIIVPLAPAPAVVETKAEAPKPVELRPVELKPVQLKPITRKTAAPRSEPAITEPNQPKPETRKPEPQKLNVGKTVEAVVAPVAAAPAPRLSWFQRLKAGLSRSSRELSDSITGIFTKRKLDEETLQDLEDVLIRADLGLETAMRISDTLSSGRYGKEVSGQEVRAVMAAEIAKVLSPVAKPLELDLSHKPHVVLVVGVNGTGKT
ncbi:MAG: signal recognition particle receptor subunit alpha, partial [Notoacmeibacter sp.]